jgi:predicted anti-sigma-YlaC factor YlaD
MTCRKVRSLIPLAAGDDLRPRRVRAVRAHIEACPACRAEFEDFQLALARIKTAAKAEGMPDWSEGEWQALMARGPALAQGSAEEKKDLRAPLMWPRWAAASAVGAFIGLVVLSVLFKAPVHDLKRTATRQVAQAAGPDVVSLTMVSQETGLQVVWFLDKKFDWKGDKE